MEENKVEFLFEYLRGIRADISGLKDDVRNVKDTITSLRTDVHALRGDILRQERALAAVEIDLDRIKTRLDLSDAPSSAS